MKQNHSHLKKTCCRSVRTAFFKRFLTFTVNYADMQVPDLNNSAELKKIYDDCFRQVLVMIINNSGTEDDAHEVFQEAIMVLYINWRDNNLALTASVCTYLQSIAWRKWLTELRRLGRTESANDESITADENALPVEQETEHRSILLSKCIDQLGDKCRNIIELLLNGMPGETIVDQLGYSSYEYYRLAKKRCIDKLKELINTYKG